MNTRRIGAAVKALIAILMVVVLLLAVIRPAGYRPENPLSAVAKTPLGMNALFLLLRDHGVSASFYGLTLDVLPPEKTLVVGDDFAGERTYTWVEPDELWKLVEEQGNTVIYLPEIDDKEFQLRIESDNGSQTQPQGNAAAKDFPEARTELGTEVACYEVPWTIDDAGYARIYTSGLPRKYFAGTTMLEAGGFTPVEVEQLSLDERMIAAAREVYFFENTDRPFLIIGEAGRGTWVSCTVSELFTNRDIGRGDNAVFALNLLSQHAGSNLAFYEAIHGYSESSVGSTRLLLFTWWGQLILLGILSLVVVLLPRIFPLGRDIPTPVVLFPSTLELVRAQAELWRQAGQLEEALRFAFVNATGVDSLRGPDEIAARLRSLGYPAQKASQLARSLTGGDRDRTRKLTAEAIQAYDRILRRFGTIRRYV